MPASELYTLSLHDALPICSPACRARSTPSARPGRRARRRPAARGHARPAAGAARVRSEEHTSELQSRRDLVCRLLLEKKKQETKSSNSTKSRVTGFTVDSK